MSSRPFLTTLAVLALAAAAAPAQTVHPVPHLDDIHFSGAYYQIARFPDKHEKQCVSNAYEMVARGDKLNQVLFVDSCKTKSSYADVRNLTAKRRQKTVPDGRLEITTFWPFTRKYWVLAAAPAFDWYIVGTPDHKNLWIYAKTATLPPDTLAQVESFAAAQGFAADRLRFTPQTGGVSQGAPVVGQ